MLLLPVGLLVQAYMLRVLSTTEIAVVAVFDIIATFCSLSDLGLLTVAVQQVPSRLKANRKDTDALALIKCSLLYQSMVLVVFGLLLFWCAPGVSQLFLKTTDYSVCIRILIPGALASTWFTFGKYLAQINEQFTLVSFWNFIDGVSQLVLGVIGFVFFGFRGYLCGIVVSKVIPLVGILWPNREFILNNSGVASFRQAFRYGFPFYIRSFLRYGFMQFDQTIIGIMLSPRTLAAYSVARRFAGLINMSIESLQNPILVRVLSMREDPTERLREFAEKAMRYTLFIVSTLCIMLASGSPWLIRLYGGEKYAGEWPLVVLLCVAQMGYASYGLWGIYVFALRPPWATLLLDGVIGFVNYICSPVFLYLMGRHGIAWGQIIAFAVGTITAVCLTPRRLNIRLDWKLIRTLAVPLLIFCTILIAGQLIYFSMWIFPLYCGLALYAFVATIGPRLSVGDWEKLSLIVPGVMIQPLKRVARA
jgi:O-antigen/teichoic acid export membrane protein